MFILRNVPPLVSSSRHPPKCVGLAQASQASAIWLQHTLILLLALLYMPLPCFKHPHLTPAVVLLASLKASHMHLKNAYGTGPFPAPLPFRTHASGPQL